jgi:hypothetical protein
MNRIKIARKKGKYDIKLKKDISKAATLLYGSKGGKIRKKKIFEGLRIQDGG